MAYVLGATMNVELTLGDRCMVAGAAHDCGYPVPAVALRVNAGGAPSGPIAPGGLVRVAVGAPVAGWIARSVVPLDLAFEYEDAIGWHPIPGVQATSHTVYTVLGPSRCSDTASVASSSDPRQMAFVAALDDVASWCATTATTTSSQALATITSAVNGAKGLRYNKSSGGPVYTSTLGMTPGAIQIRPDLSFSEFLCNESHGTSVNCADCASLVGMYGRAIGIDVKAALLLPGFKTNYVKLIGGSTWATTAFMYHAVATFSNGATVHDACLELDDGPLPWTVEPRTELLATDLPFAHYHAKASNQFVQVYTLGYPRQH